MPYTPRYEGTRWKIVYGSYEGVERYAVDELQRGLQKYLPYVMRVEPAQHGSAPDSTVPGGGPEEDSHLVLVGTPSDNPHLARLIADGLLDAPIQRQGYAIAGFASPTGPERRVIAIAGTDAPGVLYSAQEFLNQVLDAQIRVDHPDRLREALDRIEPFRVSDYPRIENRGLWTWGYVVYDYRRFLDHMARLKLNMLTLWNDEPPLNAREVIDYAHSRGVQVVMGFHWGWGIEGLRPTSAEDLERTVAEVRRNYLEHYHPLGVDGIYFQTFTETYDTAVEGRSIASLACEWVNRIADSLYEIRPDLSIQFGLHATSVTEDYLEFRGLDPRVTITWEDAGALPYSYEPVTDLRPYGYTKPEGLLTSEGSMEFSRKLVGLRESREFAMVPKGFTALRWDTEFEHHGPFILGERDPEWIARRAAERRARWDHVNALWLRNYPVAAAFYREVLACDPGRVTLTALVEDGLFESRIEPSVSLFAETAWDPARGDQELLRRALSARYRT